MENVVVASVSGRNITIADVDNVINMMDPQTAAQFKTPEGQKKLIQELVQQELMYLYALSQNYQEDEEYLQQVEGAKKSLLQRYSVNNLLRDVGVSDEEVQFFYEKNPHNFIIPEALRASHVLVSDEAAAQNVLDELGKGMTFEEAAAKFSKCPSKNKGGDLGYFPKGKMVPEFDQAAWELPMDTISDPVKTQFGYHIIKITDKKEATTRAFDDVKMQIAEHLIRMKHDQVYFQKINELKEKYDVRMIE